MRRSRPIHVDRTPVKLGFKLSSGESVEAQARVVLSGVTLDGVVLYCAEPLAPNTTVKLTIENPEKFEIDAKIVWCQYQDSSARILTPNSFPYRMGVAFGWEGKEEDKKRFETFVGRAKHHYDSIVNPAPKESELPKPSATEQATLDSAIDAAKTAVAGVGADAAATPPPAAGEAPKLEAVAGGASETPKADPAPSAESAETPAAKAA